MMIPVKPHGGTIRNWTKMPCSGGLGYYIFGEIEWLDFQQSNPSYVLKFVAGVRKDTFEIETKNSRYTLEKEKIMREEKQINPEFAVHMLNEEGIEKARDIADAFDSLLDRLKPLCGEGRAFSIVKTKLEEASFFAKKSMATQTENQKKV